jgi:Fe-S cluster assembly ATPase SufC
MALLEIKSLGKSIGPAEILKGIDLNVERAHRLREDDIASAGQFAR